MVKRLVVLLMLIGAPALAKSLYWRSLDVTARLDADGRLHIREQQAMVFDGDWNGGERKFNIRPGQSLRFERMLRVEDGRGVPMAEGNLDQVDHWYLNANNVLRWRSRLPSDPPFQNREITYALEYVLSGVLQRTDKGARLHHDFAFPDRTGEIQDFSLRLDVDPAWRGIDSPLVTKRQHLPPGADVWVDADLTYAGTGSPSEVQPTVTTSRAAIIAAALLLAGTIIVWKFYIDEKHKGRFAPLMPSAAINRAWLERYVFSLPPEVVGYAWDEESGAAEVGAVIARMEREEKIKTWMKQESALFGDKPVLHLKLLTDWNSLPPGEKALTQALFLGRNEIDTEAIRQYYASSGFQPQKLLKDSIDNALKDVREWNEPARSVSTGEVLTFIAAVITGLVAAQLAKGDASLLIVPGIIGLAIALAARRRVDVAPWAAIWFGAAIIVLGVMATFDSVQSGLTDFVALCLAVCSAFIAACILMLSRSREAIPKLEFRRRLAAARKYFETQLRSQHPNLDDAWYPYLIALGLGPDVDRWFQSFAAPSSAIGSASSFGSSSSSFSSSPSTSSWTGGGGAFGGAGASGSWAAISTIAAGVAAPGSSGSGGGGGGGGSGGGGGGGW